MTLKPFEIIKSCLIFLLVVLIVTLLVALALVLVLVGLTGVVGPVMIGGEPHDPSALSRVGGFVFIAAGSVIGGFILFTLGSICLLMVQRVVRGGRHKTIGGPDARNDAWFEFRSRAPEVRTMAGMGDDREARIGHEHAGTSDPPRRQDCGFIVQGGDRVPES